MEKLIETIKKGDSAALAILFGVVLGEIVLRGFDETEVQKVVRLAFDSKEKAAAEKAAAN